MKIDTEGIVKWYGWLAGWHQSGRDAKYEGYEEFSAWACSDVAKNILLVYNERKGDLLPFETSLVLGRALYRKSGGRE